MEVVSLGWHSPKGNRKRNSVETFVRVVQPVDAKEGRWFTLQEQPSVIPRNARRHGQAVSMYRLRAIDGEKIGPTLCAFLESLDSRRTKRAPRGNASGNWSPSDRSTFQYFWPFRRRTKRKKKTRFHGRERWKKNLKRFKNREAIITYSSQRRRCRLQWLAEESRVDGWGKEKKRSDSELRRNTSVLWAIKGSRSRVHKGRSKGVPEKSKNLRCIPDAA